MAAARLERVLRHAAQTCTIQRVATLSSFAEALVELRPHVIVAELKGTGESDVRAALALARSQRRHVPFIVVACSDVDMRRAARLRAQGADVVEWDALDRLPMFIGRAASEAAAQAARREAERRLHDIAHASRDWIWELDVEGRFTFCSPAVTKILGYSPEALIGRRYDELLDAEEGPPSAGVPAPGTGVPPREGLARWRHADGGFRWLERSVVAITDERGAVVGYRGIDRDVTERRRDEERMARLRALHDMLGAIKRAMLRATDGESVLEEACEIAVKRGGFLHAFINVVDPQSGEVAALVSASTSAPDVRGLRFSIKNPTEGGFGMTARAVETGRPSVCNDLLNDAQPIAYRQRMLSTGQRANIVVPFSIDDGLIGTLNLGAAQPGVFGEHEVALLEELALDIGATLRNLRRARLLEFLSSCDLLTGLPQRSRFCELLAREGEGASSVAVLVFDIEQIVAVNEAYGRECGDRLLQSIAERLRAAFPAVGRTAHFGGGLFAVALYGEDAKRDGRDVLAQLLGEPFDIGGVELRMAARSGSARAPEHGPAGEALVQKAEVALKQAKESGERHVAYTNPINERIAARLTLEQKLRRAVERGEFRLHYQPKFHLATRTLRGVEALLRWQTPEGENVPPATFIPVLEETGLLEEVGFWLFERALQDATCWRDAGLEPIEIAVNVSPVQLRHPGFLSRMKSIADEWHRAGAGLAIELTETAVLRDTDVVVRTLRELSSAGIRLALDDFGTGHSSLSLLAKLPVHELKIDRSFVALLGAQPRNAALVEAVRSMARAFGLGTVAEGIETPTQLQQLIGLGCEVGQGFLLGRPAGPDEILERFAPGRRAAAG